MRRLAIKDFAEVITGGTPNTSKKEYWEGGKVPWLPSGELKNCRIFQANKFITELGLKSSCAKFMPRKTVLIALTGATTGQTGILEFEATANQSVTGILPSKEHIPEYLFYFLQTQRKRILSLAYGGGQPHISQGFVKNIKVPLPSLEEQKSIAEVLSKTEFILEKRRQTLRLADEFLKSSFLEMFGDPGANSKGFKTKLIKDLVKKVFNEDPKRYPDKSYSYVDISSVDNQLKKIVETKQILGSDAPSRARQLLEAQDILISTVRPNLNAVGILSDSLSNPIGSTGFCVLRVNRELARPEYLFEICKTPFFVQSLVNVAKGASYPAVSDNDILRLSIPVPSLPEQQKFADLVQKVEKLKSKQKQSETHLQNLFNSLMQRAFKGELAQHLNIS